MEEIIQGYLLSTMLPCQWPPGFPDGGSSGFPCGGPVPLGLHGEGPQSPPGLPGGGS